MPIPSASDDELWQKLDAFTIGDPDAPLSFASRLARENGWSHDFAERVVDEYKRFLYLIARCDHAVTPSEQVDQAWHLHLVYTESYWQEMCDDLIGRPIHHRPTIGGIAEGDRFVDQYEKTLAQYRTRFSTEPPSDIWPSSEERFAPPAARWVDTSKHWLIRKPPRFSLKGLRQLLAASRRVKTIAALLLTALLVAGCASATLSSFTFTGDELREMAGAPFLKHYAILMIVALLFSLLLVRLFNGRPTKSADLDEIAYDPYDVAYLAGGGRRAVDAALARLFKDKYIQLGTTRPLLKKKEGLRRSPDPDTGRAIPPGYLEGFERTVFLALPAEGIATFEDLRSALKPATEAIRDRLRAAGLLLTGGRYFFAHLLALLPFLALIGYGLARIAIGLYRERPVGFLMALMVAIVVVMAIRLNFLRRRTPDGHRLWKQLRKKLRPARDAMVMGDSPAVTATNIKAGDERAVALAVAVFGVSALNANAHYNALNDALARSGSGANGNGGCGSGCGSGCGGGGCGGCGGCG